MIKPRTLLFKRHHPGEIPTDYLFLACLFLFGSALGHLVGGLVCTDDNRELSEYILSFAKDDSSMRALSPVSVLFSFFRAAIIVFFLGFTACGTWLIPVFMIGQGGLLAYSIHCFGVVLGRRGVMLALATLGIRCLFVLPCLFYLAVRSRSNALCVRDGKVRRDKSGVQPKNISSVVFCCFALFIGSMIELSFVPRLISTVVSRLP